MMLSFAKDKQYWFGPRCVLN